MLHGLKPSWYIFERFEEIISGTEKFSLDCATWWPDPAADAKSSWSTHWRTLSRPSGTVGCADSELVLL